MTEKHTAELERERDNWRANSVSRGKRLMKLRDMLVEVHDNIEDEGDRCYFGSTNDADALKEAWQWLDGFTMDAIIAEKDEYDLLTAIDTVRAENTNLAAELSRLRNSHTALVAALEDAATALSMATSPETPFRDTFSTCLAAWLKAKQTLAALSAEGEKDAPKDERHLTLEEQDTFSQAIRGSGTVRQTIPIAPKDDGWIEWKGGECPVSADADVDVKFGDGKEGNDFARYYEWDHRRPHEDRIVSYRVVKP